MGGSIRTRRISGAPFSPAPCCLWVCAWVALVGVPRQGRTAPSKEGRKRSPHVIHNLSVDVVHSYLVGGHSLAAHNASVVSLELDGKTYTTVADLELRAKLQRFLDEKAKFGKHGLETHQIDMSPEERQAWHEWIA